MWGRGVEESRGKCRASGVETHGCLPAGAGALPLRLRKRNPTAGGQWRGESFCAHVADAGAAPRSVVRRGRRPRQGRQPMRRAQAPLVDGGQRKKKRKKKKGRG